MKVELYILFTVEDGRPSHCYNIKVNLGQDESGEYNVYFGKTEVKKRVWCDMKTKGGGWTVCTSIHVLL